MNAKEDYSELDETHFERVWEIFEMRILRIELFDA